MSVVRSVQADLMGSRPASRASIRSKLASRSGRVGASVAGSVRSGSVASGALRRTPSAGSIQGARSIVSNFSRGSQAKGRVSSRVTGERLERLRDIQRRAELGMLLKDKLNSKFEGRVPTAKRNEIIDGHLDSFMKEEDISSNAIATLEARVAKDAHKAAIQGGFLARFQSETRPHTGSKLDDDRPPSAGRPLNYKDEYGEPLMESGVVGGWSDVQPVVPGKLIVPPETKSKDPWVQMAKLDALLFDERGAREKAALRKKQQEQRDYLFVQMQERTAKNAAYKADIRKWGEKAVEDAQRALEKERLLVEAKKRKEVEVKAMQDAEVERMKQKQARELEMKRAYEEELVRGMKASLRAEEEKEAQTRRERKAYFRKFIDDNKVEQERRAERIEAERLADVKRMEDYNAMVEAQEAKRRKALEDAAEKIRIRTQQKVKFDIVATNQADEDERRANEEQARREKLRLERERASAIKHKADTDELHATLASQIKEKEDAKVRLRKLGEEEKAEAKARQKVFEDREAEEKRTKRVKAEKLRRELEEQIRSRRPVIEGMNETERRLNRERFEMVEEKKDVLATLR